MERAEVRWRQGELSLELQVVSATSNGLINPLAMAAVCLHVQMTPVSRHLGEWSRDA